MKYFIRNKPVFVMLLLLVFVSQFGTMSVYASNGVLLSASSESGLTGQEVTVTINIANAEGNEGGQFDLTFDSDILEPVSASRGNFLPDPDNDLFQSNLDVEAGRIRIMWVIPYGSELESGVICTIVFELLDDGDTFLTFEDAILVMEDSDESVEPETTPGEIISVDPDVAKQAAIDAANQAIENLPDNITLADQAAVEAARELVDEAKNVHGAVDSDFDDIDKLLDAEEMIALLDAIKTAEDAILALPSVDSLTLDDEDAVIEARALVDLAKQDHGAQDEDFTYLDRLILAEGRIRELKGLAPTPPTGGLHYLIPIGVFVLLGSLYLWHRRSVMG